MNRPYRSTPLRYQIRKNILDFIIENRYQPGDQLPTEQELGESLGVSRFSLREALHLLEVERIISTRHGSGRYLVSLPNEYRIDITKLQSVTELLADYNLAATDKLLKVVQNAASEEVAAKLDLEAGSRVVSIERIRYAKTTPIIYSIDILPASKLPEDWKEEDFRGSLFSYLESRCGIYLDHSQATIRATLMDREVDGIVTSPLVPWILLEQVLYDLNGAPISLSKDYHRSDTIVFHVRRFRR